MNRPGERAPGSLTRRSLLRGAAGGAALAASVGLPAWAKPVAAATRLHSPDSLPFPHLPAGTASMPEIEHVVVLMMENHSFDNFLGMVPHEVAGRAGVDGFTVKHGRLTNTNREPSGHKSHPAGGRERRVRQHSTPA